jgi:hypothetical protein
VIRHAGIDGKTRRAGFTETQRMALKKLHDFFDSDMLPNSLILSHVLVAKMAGRALELKDIELAWCRGGIELTLYLLVITALKNYLWLKGQQKGQQFLVVPFWYGWHALGPRRLKNLLRKPAQAVPGASNRVPVGLPDDFS